MSEFSRENYVNPPMKQISNLTVFVTIYNMVCKIGAYSGKQQKVHFSSTFIILLRTENGKLYLEFTTCMRVVRMH